MINAAFGLVKLVAKAALNMVGVGVVGEIAAEMIPEVARDVWDKWGKGRKEEDQRAELQAIAEAPPEEVKQVVEDIVLEVAGDQPPDVQLRLVTYLTQIPAAIRASMSGSGSGSVNKSFLPELSFQGPEDLIPILPSHMPRFKSGDRPVPGVDWEVVELLGMGGFGEVWKARNVHFNNIPPVALKFCLDPKAKDRLLRHEASVLNQVMRQGKHPGIVALQQTYLSNDPPCLEYEYVSGGDLSRLIRDLHRRHSGVELYQQLHRLVKELFEIVAFAHRLTPPVVHRDLKPANILVEYRPNGSWQLRITDFGISGLVADQLIARTRGGVSQGLFQLTALRGAHTPLYASPQQMHGAAPKPQDDVHALGVIWYQMLVGNLSFGKPSGTRWIQRLTDLGIPRPLIELLGECCEEDPADRPKDANELLERFTKLVDSSDSPKTDSIPKRDLVAELQHAKEESSRLTELAYQQIQKHNYEEAVRILESVTSSFQDASLLFDTRKKRDRVRELDRAIRESIESRQLQNIRTQVEELLLLQPHREDLRKLIDLLPGTLSPPSIVLPKRIKNSIGMTFSLIPSGSFLMGSPPSESDRLADEGPQHRVTITKSFYLGIYPVTQTQYQAIMGSNSSQFTKKSGGGNEHPVEQVSWEEATEFCKKLTRLAAEKKENRVYRLPTEAEWEYACRGGTITAFFFGDDASSQQANFDGTRPYGMGKSSTNREKTTKAGTFTGIEHPFGLFDMHGNVWEWCSDWYDEKYYSKSPEQDPQGPTKGDRKVLRGGCWNNSGHLCRSARRQKYAVDFRNPTIGFRVVCVVG